MKVRELKQILSTLDDNTEVYIDMLTDDQYETDDIWVSNVREPYDLNNLRSVRDMKIAQRPHLKNKGAKKCLIL